jgi:hypothetical protein
MDWHYKTIDFIHGVYLFIRLLVVFILSIGESSAENYGAA